MTKALSLTTVALLATALTACGGTTTTTVTSTITAAPTTTAAATTTTTPAKPAGAAVSKTCTVTAVPNVTPSSISVQLTAKGYVAKSLPLVGCPTASSLVKIVAATKAQMPVKTNNFNCTPTVTGKSTGFDCLITTGAAGSVKYDFTLIYN
ncbi:MAG: hypothetical protein F2799_05670 [Actinobacteria bacterium]|uniref:Unannotated protein n=1 Tax=freshwater metagenome TaxID=449393 RepID=A0A6J7EDE2_9ZZZZ|nr:hypothetical protein [Actinomycetota bacterium]